MLKKYKLEGLDCANCAMKVERELNKLVFIHEATVNFATLKCMIEYDEYTEENEKEVIQLIKRLEDEVTVVLLETKETCHEECCCGHDHHEHEHEECCCGHDHHEHNHEECCCGHDHHEHNHEECCCGHDHHEHNHEECCCEHDHHEHNHEECCCGHDHHEHEHEECCCGHDHHEHEHEECCCGHDHHEHNHKEKQASHDSIKVKWQIEGLDCAHCALKVEDAVNKVSGVDTATLNFTTKTLIFFVLKNKQVEEVKKQVKQAILKVEAVDIIEENEKHEKKVNKKYLGIWLGIPLMIAGMLISNNGLIILSYFCVGSHVILKAFKNIKRGEVFDENFLMMIATLGAIVVGEYIEAIAVMLFYQIGEYFQDKAVEKSRKSIADLMDIQSEIAHLYNHEEIRDVHPDTINVGDVIIVKPGERIPLDGTILEGEGSLDTSALTGESYPTNVTVGSDVLSGCINLNGLLKIKVSKIARESAVSRILDLVENAASKKAKTELKMTKFARIYTPIVVFAALAVAIIPNFFNTGISWNEWLIRACTFLVISCPCALVLSIPLGYFAGIGSSSRNGILVKGGNYLEVLNEIETVVFDKTGTLTTGTFKVQKIYSEQKEDCLEMAALAESYSNHPIASSIVEAYGLEINNSRIENVNEIAGNGIKATIDGKTILVGNKKLMDDEGISIPEITTIGTLVYVSVNHEYLGTIEISDALKSTTKQALHDLKKNGIKKLVMLSGDRLATAQAIGKEVGIDEIHAQLLPTDKVSEIEKILDNPANGKVAFVGDGINDAPVLARCDLGIAMGGLGSEAAIEASDIVLMKDDLQALNKGIQIARKTQRIMNQNIIFILAIKFMVLGLSVFGYANMWLGVFADVGVSLLAVLNAMRILESK